MSRHVGLIIWCGMKRGNRMAIINDVLPASSVSSQLLLHMLIVDSDAVSFHHSRRQFQ
jgi:hypothetical protein